MRKYYSARVKKNPDVVQVTLDMLQRMFLAIYKSFDNRGYFQEAFGISCVDGGSNGSLGSDIEAAMFLTLRKQNLWPIFMRCLYYSEEDLFDVIEFLFDHISKPIDGFYHEFNNCGYHYNQFNKAEGQKEFIEKMNEILADYSRGFKLSNTGEILFLAEKGMEHLLIADIPKHNPQNVEAKVESSVNKFRRYKSTIDERHAAVRELADVLEFLRPKLKDALTSKDEADLFNLANNFAIRHHNQNQKADYDKNIWLSWMFYFYLATIHASLRLIEKRNKK